jgi:hypothetical protein
MSTPRVAWLLLLTGLACASRREPAEDASTGQSYAEAVRLICTVDARLDPDALADPLARSRARWERIHDEIEQPDAIYLRTLLEAKPPREGSTILANEAQRVGVAPCPLVTALAEDDEP